MTVMVNSLYLIYAAIAYALGMASLAYLFGFLIDFGVPKGINDGEYHSLWRSILWDTSLVLCFGLHHSVTARSSFKRCWTQWVPQAIERSSYVLMAALLTFVVVYFWKPIPIKIWSADSQLWSGAILAAYASTWMMMVASTFHFGHFGFMGLRQAWERYLNRPAHPVPFTVRYLYALVRHPIGLGWMLMPWLTPNMTVGQLVWAVTVTIYVLVATRFEENDLIREIGDGYRKYRTDVPMFVPRIK